LGREAPTVSRADCGRVLWRSLESRPRAIRLRAPKGGLGGSRAGQGPGVPSREGLGAHMHLSDVYGMCIIALTIVMVVVVLDYLVFG